MTFVCRLARTSRTQLHAHLLPSFQRTEEETVKASLPLFFLLPCLATGGRVSSLSPAASRAIFALSAFSRRRPLSPQAASLSLSAQGRRSVLRNPSPVNRKIIIADAFLRRPPRNRTAKETKAGSPLKGGGVVRRRHPQRKHHLHQNGPRRKTIRARPGSRPEEQEKVCPKRKRIRGSCPPPRHHGR